MLESLIRFWKTPSFQMKCACGVANQFQKVLSGKHKKKIEGERPKKFKFWIVRCEACGLNQTYPRPYESSASSIYYQEKKDVESRVNDIDSIRTYAKAILERVKKFKTEGRFIDLGASIGVLVHEAQKSGFQNATGVELNAYAIQKAKELLNVGLLKGDMLDQAFQDDAIDIFTLSQTLEHIENPIQVLKTLHRRLKKEGILYLDVPNFDSVMADVLKEKWGLLDPCRHLWQFTPASLKWMLSQSGFEKVHFILTENNNYTYELEHASESQRFFLQEKLRIGTQTHRGDVLICIAQKT